MLLSSLNFKRCALASCVTLLAGCNGEPTHSQNQIAEVAPEQRRALIVSIDSLNEHNLLSTVPRDNIPNFNRLFEQGACTEFAQPAFPSVTAAGHSAIWTGAYGNVSNISGNSAHRLPRNENTVMSLVSGYDADNASAEQIWITAALNGRSAGGHHATQAPRIPGFPSRVGTPTDSALADQARIANAYEQPQLNVMNGYNIQVNYDAVVTEETVTWLPDGEWQNSEQLNFTDAVTPRYFQWQTRVGTFYGVFYGEQQHDRIAVNSEPNATGAIVAVAHPTESTEPLGRTLARYFSEPLRVTTERGDTFLRLRLFEASPNGESFLFYHPAMHVIDVNHAELAEKYNNKVQGWFGNSATRTYSRGGFGAPFFRGGNGEAEARYLETAELATELFNRGSTFFWQELGVDLLVDYFPMGDSIDHTIAGYLATDWPGYTQLAAEKAADLRNRTWQLVDLRLAHLMQLTQAADSTLFVAGDHGMRASWKEFLPNVLLQQAGLQTLDNNGMVDLSRSQAVSPNAYWITVNTTEWRSGIVDETEKAQVIERIVSALNALTDSQGKKVIERVYVASEHPELGMGGAAGGDVYWIPATGYRSSRNVNGNVLNERASIGAGHSYGSTSPDMYTVTCAYGEQFPSHRIPSSRLIDIAPTVAEYLGIPAPKHAVGKSLYQQLRAQ